MIVFVKCNRDFKQDSFSFLGGWKKTFKALPWKQNRALNVLSRAFEINTIEKDIWLFELFFSWKIHMIYPCVILSLKRFNEMLVKTQEAEAITLQVIATWSSFFCISLKLKQWNENSWHFPICKSIRTWHNFLFCGKEHKSSPCYWHTGCSDVKSKFQL